MTRIFVVRVPAGYTGRTPLPMVIAFHPGGMSAQYMQGRVPVHRVWPEAIAVFPEGFPNIDGGRGGLQPVWQRAPGDMEDRDLAYFDQMIEWLRANHCFDAKKVFVMGYSNGAGFTSVLACRAARVSLPAWRSPRAGWRARPPSRSRSSSVTVCRMRQSPTTTAWTPRPRGRRGTNAARRRSTARRDASRPTRARKRP